MAEVAEGSPAGRLRRLRWRMSGAWLWPAFVVVTTLEMGLLHWLPIAGKGSGWIPALLLAGCLNVIAIALLGGLGGGALRRIRRDLPKVVADDYAGLAALAAVGLAFLVAGIVHRPELADERKAFARQSAAVRLWVAAHGDDFARAHVGAADTVQVDRDLYRTCVPEPDVKRWLCLVVDTSRRPPHVRRDTSRESNASQNPRGVFR
ncbi:MAG: hypothetical protein QOG42_438 [Solirubrobacteraceae bacterium]|jgi:hypothetical protein|nr:hypothetical protein [Solirubrobacteraceae bacterium]